MAMHDVCPKDKDVPLDQIPIVGASIRMVRCKNIEKRLCKGDGITLNSATWYCEDCSSFYGICEICGDPL